MLLKPHSLAELADLMVLARTMLLVLAGAALLGVFAAGAYRAYFSPSSLSARLASVHVPNVAAALPCPIGFGEKPLMVLAIGQSNAGNHGAALAPDSPSAWFFYDGRCYLTAGPVPGATGVGGSIWTYLSPLLNAKLGRPVIFSVLAVDATSIVDWADDTLLRTRLVTTIREGIAHGFAPELVLLQHGEADARSGLSATVYREKLEKLNAYVRQELGTPKMIVAQSTFCRNEGSAAIRSALQKLASEGNGIVLGPDTDVLRGDFRVDGCHFSVDGLKAASALWASAIVSSLTIGVGVDLSMPGSGQGKSLRGG